MDSSSSDQLSRITREGRQTPSWCQMSVDNVPRRVLCGVRTKDPLDRPTDGSFGLVLHVCCTQRGFQLEPTIHPGRRPSR
jgi:hypothetical protein